MESFSTLIDNQHEAGQEIQQIIRNFNNDSADRKGNVSYYKDRLIRLQNIWDRFKATDNRIRILDEPPSDDQYFTKDYYNKMMALVETYTTIFNDAIKKLESQLASQGATSKPTLEEAANNAITQPNKDDKEEEVSRVYALIRKQQAIIASLQRLLKSTTKDVSPQQFLIAMEKLWAPIEDANFTLWEIHNNPTSLGYDMDGYIQLEEQVRHQRGLLTQANTTTPQIEATARSTEIATSLQLPKIELPIFDGDYLKWRQFHDLFIEIIHKQSIPKCQKIWYLKTNLRGEAERLLRHFTVTAENYDSAWAALRERYNNPRQLASTLIHKLLDQPSSSQETTSVNFIKNIHDTTKECLQCLENLGISSNGWDPLLIHILIRKIDRATHALFEQSLANPKEVPTLCTFLSFLEARFQSLEAAGFKHKEKPGNHKVFTSAIDHKPKSQNCKLYKQQPHALYFCAEFKKLSPAKRLHYVQRQNLCTNCLRSGHAATSCQSRTCLKCARKHNTMLHLDSLPTKLKPDTNTVVKEVLGTSNNTSLAACQAKGHVLLSTALVQIYNNQGKPVTCRAILDCGSQASYITKKLASKLRLQRKYDPQQVNGIGQSTQHSDHRMTVLVSSRINAFKVKLEVFILPRITSAVPSAPIDITKWAIPANLPLADPEFHTPGPVDLLIGNEVFYETLMIGQVKLGKQLPILQNTTFGWVLGGVALDSTAAPTTISTSSTFCGIGTSEELHKQVNKFWQLEEIEDKAAPLTTTEKKCEMFFAQTVRRLPHGRFSVRLPFAQKPTVLGDSKTVSLQRFYALERRLQKNPELRTSYIEFMREYAALGHMKKFDVNNVTSIPHYFIPHHCVIKPESTSTKLRVVFDASMTTSSNFSLNDILLTGPKLQRELFSVLLRFRMPRYVFTADIEKMYRQIKVDEQDWPFQLIWWRENPTDPVKCFSLNTVTYGIKSAPYLAIKCLQNVALKHQVTNPLGAEAIQRDFYVDDLMSGADSIAEATTIQEQIIKILQGAGFKLKKWCANHPSLYNNIPLQDRAQQTEIVQHDTTIKTLGMVWNPTNDEFHLRIQTTEPTKVTKRQVLSEIAHIFDPLGILSPVVTRAKIFLQQLWTLKLDWDSAVPLELHTYWNQFRENLSKLDKVKIPRHLLSAKHAKTQELHVFCDASEKAYGAVVYGRALLHDGTIIVRWMCARSRVAPNKTISLPRLELCAAHLAAKLLERVRTDLSWTHPCFLWSDSEITLAWISAQSALYQTFVANRVAAIQELTTHNQWRYVPTKHNPADLVSRGLNPQDFNSNTLWHYGPLFLHGSSSQWPENLSHPVTEVEKRKKISLFSSVAATTLIDSINHRNSFKLLVRISAYVRRFINKCRKSSRYTTKGLDVAEIEDATITILRETQYFDFNIEINQLQRHGSVTNSSSISSLTPFLDNCHILRVGGRLQNSELPYESKHPILLPYGHIVTRMLMTDIHLTNSHVSPQGLLSITRQRYWPIKGKTIARSIVQNCTRCVRSKPKLLTQHMGSLPAQRVQPARPFVNSGVDFCGPFYIHFKIRGKQPRKCYVAIFCCFSTKAVHIEIVSDLTTDSFIGALKRFTSRRGNCRHIHCDNATNFVGAKNQLQDLTEIVHSQEAQESIKRFGHDRRIEFHFIPPRSPHFGGLWEAAVKSAKHLFYKGVNAASLTYEEMETVFTEIEAILNSRPITPMSDDPNEFKALTPGHFLIGEPLTSTIDHSATEYKGNLHQRWRTVSSLNKEFWHRWTKEYLCELQHKYKWKQSSSNIKAGTMVVIHEDNLPSLKWKLGRIIRPICGDDGLVRVAEVQTASGAITRAIHRLAPLPNTSSESHTDQAPTTQDPSSNELQTNGRRKRAAAVEQNSTKCFRGLSTAPLPCLKR